MNRFDDSQPSSASDEEADQMPGRSSGETPPPSPVLDDEPEQTQAGSPDEVPPPSSPAPSSRSNDSTAVCLAVFAGAFAAFAFFAAFAAAMGALQLLKGVCGEYLEFFIKFSARVFDRDVEWIHVR